MSEMGAAEFKAHCLQVMETVRRTRREVVITKRGVPVAKLVPVAPAADLALGALSGRFTSSGDIVSSPRRDEEWKALERAESARWQRLVRETAPRSKRRRRR